MKGPAVHLGISVLVLAAAAGAYAFGYLQVTNAKQEAANLASAIAAREAEQERGASARSRLAEVAADEEFLASRLVADADIVAFLEGLEGAGDEFGAIVKVASVSGDSAAADGRITLALSIEGSFAAVMKTLGVIEYGPYALSPRDVSISGAGDSWVLTGSFIALAATP